MGQATAEVYPAIPRPRTRRPARAKARAIPVRAPPGARTMRKIRLRVRR